MKKVLPCLGALLLMPAASLAQTATSNQIDAVYAAQQQQEDAYRAAQVAQQEQEMHDRQVEERRTQLQEAATAAHERERMAAAKAREQRDQSYQDQLRSIDIQQQMLVLQAEKTRVARENEFIDRELAQKSADTDVTRSDAEATRNLSSGARTLLERTGEAEVNAASGGKPPTKVADHVDHSE